MLQGWDKQKQLNELARIEGDMAILLREAEGYFFTDHGYQPNPLVQARNRFLEATMWARRWIESEK